MNWKRIETQAREEYAKLKAENELLKTQMDELKEHIDQLEAAEGATCPLCGQALSEEHRQSTLKQLQDEGKEKGDRFRTNKTSIDDLAKQIADYELQIAKVESAERERLKQSNSVTQLTERIETIKEFNQELGNGWRKTIEGSGKNIIK